MQSLLLFGCSSEVTGGVHDSRIFFKSKFNQICPILQQADCWKWNESSDLYLRGLDIPFASAFDEGIPKRWERWERTHFGCRLSTTMDIIFKTLWYFTKFSFHLKWNETSLLVINIADTSCLTICDTTEELRS